MNPTRVCAGAPVKMYEGIVEMGQNPEMIIKSEPEVNIVEMDTAESPAIKTEQPERFRWADVEDPESTHVATTNQRG